MENIVTTVANRFISTTKKQGAMKIHSQLLAGGREKSITQN